MLWFKVTVINRHNRKQPAERRTVASTAAKIRIVRGAAGYTRYCEKQDNNWEVQEGEEMRRGLEREGGEEGAREGAGEGGGA